MSSCYSKQMLELAHGGVTLAQQLSVNHLSSPSELDQAIDAAISGLAEEERFEAELAFGAWLGEFLRNTFNGRWMGFDEPVPPRIEMSGLIVSPIEAVQRRFASDSHPRIATLVAELSRVLPQKPVNREHVLEINAHAWEQLRHQEQFSLDDLKDLESSLPQSPLDPWLPSDEIRGRKVLLLGAAGLTHGPLFERAGARVTIVDFSEGMLEIDRRGAALFGLDLRLVKASADALPPLEDEPFDVVVQPVLSCYLPDVLALYREVHRVLRPGGLYLSQHKQPLAMRTKWLDSLDGYWVGKAVLQDNALHQRGTVEFAHELSDLLGGLCRTGFVIEDVNEPLRSDWWAPPGTLEHAANFVRPYLKIKARRK